MFGYVDALFSVDNVDAVFGLSTLSTIACDIAVFYPIAQMGKKNK